MSRTIVATRPAPARTTIGGPAPDAQAPAADRPAPAAAPVRPSDLLAGLAVLIACQLLGEALRLVLHLPVPGAVLGMLILAAVLVARAPAGAAGTGRDTSLDRTAEALIGRMGLLFVPAGAGVVAEAGLLREAWLPLAAGLIGSTVLSLIVTGLVMHWTTRAPRGPAATPRDGVR